MVDSISASSSGGSSFKTAGSIPPGNLTVTFSGYSEKDNSLFILNAWGNDTEEEMLWNDFLVLTFARLSWGDPVFSRLAVPDDPLDLVNRELFQKHYRFRPLLKVLHQTQPLQFNLRLAPHLTFSWPAAILIAFDLGKKQKQKKESAKPSDYEVQTSIKFTHKVLDRKNTNRKEKKII